MPTITKRYEYKVFNGSTYLGLIPNVTTDFEYTQEINSSSVEVQIDVALPTDRSAEAVEAILTEGGDPITDEFGDPLLIERQPDYMGVLGSDRTLIANGNTIHVYEFSDHDPNGVLIFKGTITRWNANFGDTDTITISILGLGADLDQYITQSNDTYTQEIVQSSSNSEIQFRDDPGLVYIRFQEITPAANLLLSKVSIKLRVPDNPVPKNIPQNFYLWIWNLNVPSIYGGASVDNIMGIYSFTVSNTTADFVDIILSTPVVLTAGTTYSMNIDNLDINGTTGTGNPNATCYISVDTLSPYAAGRAYSYLATPPAVGSGTLAEEGYDWAFKLYSSTNSVRAVYTSDDPSDILRQGLLNYNGRGGQATYTSTSIDSTGLSVSYTFNTNTALELVQKVRELAPSGWYWYVDPATQILTFKATPTTATHRFIKGNHIENLNLRLTIETVKNVVYFTGGDTGSGENLFTNYTNQDSIDETSLIRLERMSDSRVTVQATADAIADSFLDENAGEVYQSELTILDSTYDTNTINVGDTVSVIGFGNFIDSLIFQIARKKISPDRVVLSLGVLPFRQDKQIDDIGRSLDQLRVVDNPDSPS